MIELLVVIAIIGLLSTLAVVALNSARMKARDAGRLANVKEIQTALELYFNDANTYPPTAVISGTCLSYLSGDASSGFGAACVSGANAITYMQTVPTAPLPLDGDCAAGQNTYTYTLLTADSYTLSYCLGGTTGGVVCPASGACTHTATPGMIQ